MAKLELRKLTKRYGDVVAVDQLDLDVRDRELTVLVGPSGCGKTTTLRMIAGLENITDGQVFIGSRMVNNVAPRDRNVAMVFQNGALYPHMNVFQNMAFGLKMRGLPRSAREQRVREAAAALGIVDLLPRKPAQLSGGQRQRVALGRTIVRDPDVFLLDEPLSNLDANLRDSMRCELVRLHRRLETTMLHVTHDQVEAMLMGDRIVVMRGGRVQQAGHPMQIYDSPSNRFVAEFIGRPPMNFFAATVDPDGCRLRARGLVFDLPVTHIERVGAHLGKDIVLGIRPEHISCSPPVDRQLPTSRLSATLLAARPTGAETILDLKAGELELVARVGGRGEYQRGQSLQVYPDMKRSHLFDPLTGATL